MTSASLAQIESFVFAACEHLKIPIRRVDASVIEIEVPDRWRRHFGNLDEIRVTSSAQMRRIDPQLELLSGSSFLVQMLIDLVTPKDLVLATLVAGVPARVEASAYAEAFHRRFLDAKKRPGSLPRGFRLVELAESIAFRSYLRVLADIRVEGVAPIHEVFPIIVEARSGKAVDPRRFAQRTLYAREEAGSLAAMIPKLPEADELAAAIEGARKQAIETAQVLVASAAGARTGAAGSAAGGARRILCVAGR